MPKVKKWVQVGEQRGAVEAGRIRPGRSCWRAGSRSFVGSVSSRELNQHSWLGALGFFYCGWWVDRQQVKWEAPGVAGEWSHAHDESQTDTPLPLLSLSLFQMCFTFSLSIHNFSSTSMRCVSTQSTTAGANVCASNEQTGWCGCMFWGLCKPGSLCVGVRFLLSVPI